MENDARTAGWRGFSALQWARLVATGVVVWLLGALLLRFLAPLGAYNGLGRVLMYALIIPGTLPLVLPLPVLAGIRRSAIAAGTAIVVASAILMDGIALAWFPVLYGETVAQHAGAGAAILWGGAIALFLGFLCTRD